MLPLQIIPPGLQKLIIINFIQLHPPRLNLHLAENIILVIAQLPVQRSQLRRSQSPRRGLHDVDVGDGGVVGIFGDVQCDGCKADGFAEEPAYALLCGSESADDRGGGGLGVF